MQRKTIQILAPVAPKCFSSRDQWIEYLLDAQVSRKDHTSRKAHSSRKDKGDTDRRPFVDGKYRTGFSFCADCNAQHALAMTNAGRCDFQGYVADLKNAEDEHAVAV